MQLRNAPARAASAIASGVLLALAMPKFSWWPLAWLAPALLLHSVRDLPWRPAAVLGWVAGFSFYLPALYWLAPTVVSYTRIGWAAACGLVVLLCAVEACYIATIAAAVAWIGGGAWRRVFVAPAAWVVVEWLRTFFPAPFPWIPLATSQVAGPLVLVQVADLAGCYGVSWAIVLVGAALAEALAVRREAVAGEPVAGAPPGSSSLKRGGGLVALAAAVIAAVVGYGHWRLSELEAAQEDSHGLTAAIVQGNIPQRLKWQMDRQDEILSRYLELSRQAAASGARLIVWPEAAVPFFLEYDKRRSRLVELATTTGAALVVGAPGYRDTPAGPRQYNEAWLILPGRGLAGYYDKIQLVPFGEYVPWGPLLAWVDKAVEAVGDFGRGSAAVVFEVPDDAHDGNVRLGVLICYEAIFPSFVRRFVLGGARLLVNISNDAWYGRSAAPYQHLAMAALRAVENRVPLVRATNTGISAFVDATGRIHERTPLFEEAVRIRTVAPGRAASLYVRFGNWLVWASLLLLAMAAAAKLRRRE